MWEVLLFATHRLLPPGVTLSELSSPPLSQICGLGKIQIMAWTSPIFLGSKMGTSDQYSADLLWGLWGPCLCLEMPEASLSEPVLLSVGVRVSWRLGGCTK